jgi:phosphoribosyl-AMP cyclohydrolase
LGYNRGHYFNGGWTVAKVDAKRLEEGSELLIDFEKLDKVAQCGEAVVPVAVQNADSKQVLFVAYANQTALDHALEHGVATFWSTSRSELWVKGATSGDTLQLVEVRINCEQNSLLYLVRPLGEGACHTKGADGTSRRSCYYRRIKDGKLELVESVGHVNNVTTPQESRS